MGLADENGDQILGILDHIWLRLFGLGGQHYTVERTDTVQHLLGLNRPLT